ncbi:MAG: hypothetical protein QM784_40430 [Polyangiaceae bacterium]
MGLLPATVDQLRRSTRLQSRSYHFLGEVHLKWLRVLATKKLSDEEAGALLVARAAGAFGDATLQKISLTDTLQSPPHRLRSCEWSYV